MRVPVAFGLVLALSACVGVDWRAPSGMPDGPAGSVYTQSPNPTLSLDPPRALGLAGALAYGISEYAGPSAYLGAAAAAAVAVYVIHDPLAPNWTIEESVLDPQTYRLSMRAKSFRTGGDGESGLILRRRALQLQRERGFAGYRIAEYTEGIESSTPFTHRFAEGIIQLVSVAPGGAR